MTKRKIIIFVIVVVLISTAFSKIYFSYFTKQNQVDLGGKMFNVEIADTSSLQERGLSGHKPLLNNEGMLFVFDNPGIYKFWMKDMLFPLDIIWISSDWHIIGFEKSLSPSTYPNSFGPETPSQYVLEVSSGKVLKLNIKIGDKVVFLKK